MSDKKKRAKSKKRQQHDDNGCALIAVDGCYYLSLPRPRDGCFGFDADGGCFDFGGACSMVFLPLRWLIIVGLMLYGDWDYAQGRTKETRP